MATPMMKSTANVMFAASRNAVSTGLFLVVLAVGLLGFIAVNHFSGADVLGALSFAAGYLLHAGVSLIRRVF